MGVTLANNPGVACARWRSLRWIMARFTLGPPRTINELRKLTLRCMFGLVVR